MNTSKKVFLNGKLMLTQALLLLTLLSCRKEAIDYQSSSLQETAFNTQSALAASTAIGQSLSAESLLFEETVEGSSPFSTAHNLENCGLDYALSFVSNPVYQGNKVARFEIRNDQPLVGSSNKIRSEATIIKGTEDSRFTANIWYSFAVNFPSVGYEIDDTREAINQWYEDGSDETTLRSEKNKVYLEVCPPSGSSTLKKYDLFHPSLATSGGTTTGSPTSFVDIPKDTWNEFVFHFVHSKDSDGLIEVWRNGVKIHHITGRNMHSILPKWKIGLYKASFLDKSSIRSSRVIYYDNIRVGNASSTLASMSSLDVPTSTPTPTETATSTPTPTPTPTTSGTGTQVTSFTLINASTDEDIMTINNGATISMAALPGTPSKLAIRANTYPAIVPVVSMEMSGADSKIRIDDQIPYAMFGDDGSGNYSSWTPVLGNITIKATCYSGTKRSLGSATSPQYTINFTLVK